MRAHAGKNWWLVVGLAGTLAWAPVAWAAGAELATATLIKKAQEACEALEYVDCVDRATTALSREDLTDAQRVVAYEMQAGSLTVLGKGAEAERAYRLLLRLRPDHALPQDTPPKMAALFRKVQAEEGEIRRAVKEAERKKLLQAISLSMDAPARHQGGTPLAIKVNAQDPLGGIRTMTLAYRMGATGDFATVPLTFRNNAWVVEFTGAQTASDAPQVMQYTVAVKDSAGDVLTSLGSRQRPFSVDIQPGQVQGPAFYTQPRFWAVAGGGVAAAAAVGLVAVVLVAVGGSAAAVVAYLVSRNDNTPQTTLGKQRIP